MTSVDIRTLATTTPRPSHRPSAHDYSKNPMLVYWEMTQACALACRHCRAEAVSDPHPDQLTNAESKDLLRQIAAFDKPHLILTGGDPLKRADIFELIDEARGLGLTVSITPSATPELTRDVLEKLKAHGIDSLGLSLDGSTAARHEAVRGVPGCFDWTMRAMKDAGELGFPIQVNTLVSEETADDLPAIFELLKSMKVMRWSLFFLIAVGRGKTLQPVSPERGEELMQLDLRPVPHRSFSGQDHRSAVLSSHCVNRDASRGNVRAGNRTYSRLSRIWYSRRPWHHVRLQPGRCVSRRISASRRRQHSQR